MKTLLNVVARDSSSLQIQKQILKANLLEVRAEMFMYNTRTHLELIEPLVKSLNDEIKPCRPSFRYTISDDKPRLITPEMFHLEEYYTDKGRIQWRRADSWIDRGKTLDRAWAENAL